MNMNEIIKMPGVETWQSCEYARVTQSAEYALISLNMP